MESDYIVTQSDIGYYGRQQHSKQRTEEEDIYIARPEPDIKPYDDHRETEAVPPQTSVETDLYWSIGSGSCGQQEQDGPGPGPVSAAVAEEEEGTNGLHLELEPAEYVSQKTQTELSALGGEEVPYL